MHLRSLRSAGDVQVEFTPTVPAGYVITGPGSPGSPDSTVTLGPGEEVEREVTLTAPPTPSGSGSSGSSTATIDLGARLSGGSPIAPIRLGVTLSE